MSVTVPPPPYKIPVADKNGTMSAAWKAWFRDLFARMGGMVALSNIELEDLQDLTNIEADIDDLETLTATHTSQISTLQTQVNDLGQGPNL